MPKRFCAALLLLLLGLLGAGCAAAPAQSPAPTPNEDSSMAANTTPASGYLYEITENQFHKGLSLELTAEQAAAILAAYEKASVAPETRESTQDAHYMVFLYNDAGAELLALWLDAEGAVYNDQGHLMTGDALREVLADLVAEK